MGNFITATLYDNDFTQHLQAGVPYIAEYAEDDLSEEEFREWLIEYMVFYSVIRVINRNNKKTKEYLDHLRDYFVKNLRVKYSNTKPAYYGENFEIVMYDRALKYVWTA